MTSNRWEEALTDLVLRLDIILFFRGHSGEHRRDLRPSVLNDGAKAKNLA